MLRASRRLGLASSVMAGEYPTPVRQASSAEPIPLSIVDALGVLLLPLLQLRLGLLRQLSSPLRVPDHLAPSLEVSSRQLLLRHRRLRAAPRSARASVRCRSR